MEKSQKQRAITRMPCVKTANTWLYWFMLPFPVCFVVHGRMCAFGCGRASVRLTGDAKSTPVASKQTNTGQMKEMEKRVRESAESAR